MKKNRTLLELLAGIIFLGVIIQIVCLIVSENYLYDAVGLWCGIGICCFSAINIQKSIERAMASEGTDPAGSVKRGYLKRMVISLLIMGCVVFFQVGHIFTLLIGVFPLKIAAYMQPFTHKVFLKLGAKEKEVD